jgi:hypothetical protein
MWRGPEFDVGLAPAPAPAKLGRRMLHPLQCLDGSHYLMKNLVRNEVARKNHIKGARNLSSLHENGKDSSVFF